MMVLSVVAQAKRADLWSTLVGRFVRSLTFPIDRLYRKLVTHIARNVRVQFVWSAAPVESQSQPAAEQHTFQSQHKRIRGLWIRQWSNSMPAACADVGLAFNWFNPWTIRCWVFCSWQQNAMMRSFAFYYIYWCLCPVSLVLLVVFVLIICYNIKSGNNDHMTRFYVHSMFGGNDNIRSRSRTRTKSENGTWRLPNQTPTVREGDLEATHKSDINFID